jgi:uncharacterized glyoxalase superfamily protein PhnB
MLGSYKPGAEWCREPGTAGGYTVTAAEDSIISVCTDDIDSAYAEAQELGYEIVHPLTTEAWGLRRFFVRAPDGNVVNVTNHRD